MLNSTQRAAKRRLLAREGGLCITCCKVRPLADLRVCEGCKVGAIQRTRRRREQIHQREAQQYIAAAHERVGDAAQDHHLYGDAALAYRKALDLQVIQIPDRLRITEKLIRACFLGENPSEATLLVKWVTRHYVNEPGAGERAVEALILLSTQLNFNSKPQLALMVINQAAALASKFQLGNLRTICSQYLSSRMSCRRRSDES